MTISLAPGGNWSPSAAGYTWTPPEASPTGMPPTAQPGIEPPVDTEARPLSLAGSENVPLLRMLGPATFGWEAAAVPAKGTHKLPAQVTAAARYYVFIVYLPL